MMNAGFLRGVQQVFVPKFDPAVIMENFHKYKINIFAGVPTMYWSLLNYKHESIPDDQIKTHLRTCVSGGASLPVQVLEDFEKRFEVSVLEGYGMSEGSPVVTFNDYNIGTKPGSIGVPVWGVEVKIVDTDGNELSNNEPGELAYKGHNVMKGYYKNPEATAEVLKDGWIHSGDVAYRDKDGFYFIVDRTKDMIIRGGMNVYSREIEEVLMKNPAISLAAVIGIPDEKLGEEIKAFVVLKEAVNVEPDILISWAKENLAIYKYPRIIEIVKELPLSATGKVLKKELRNHKI
jgi:long-chain acyl-CoA synthetase